MTRRKVSRREAALRAAQDQDDAWARDLGGPLLQPIDPDDAPWACGHVGCRRDAAWIVRFNVGRADEYGMTACGRHLGAMTAATANLIAEVDTGGRT